MEKLFNINPRSGYYGSRMAENTDLYRAKYGLPLDGESHERFIATKVPYRKNKDYRPRFRNYSFGYPTYKKDNYTRHLYNLQDIWSSDAKPIKFFKLYIKAYITSTIYLLKPQKEVWSSKFFTTTLESEKYLTSQDYVKKIDFYSSLKSHFYKTLRPSSMFALAATSYYFLVAKLQDWGYSKAQSFLRASFIIAPVITLYKYDRPQKNFFFTSTIIALILFMFNFAYHVQRFWGITGPATINSEKFYLKEVSPEEILKIEYEDKLLKYARLFDLTNTFRYEENRYNVRLKKALQAAH